MKEEMTTMKEKMTTINKEAIGRLILYAYEGAYEEAKRQKQRDEKALRETGNHNKATIEKIDQIYKDIDILDEIHKRWKTM